MTHIAIQEARNGIGRPASPAQAISAKSAGRSIDLIGSDRSSSSAIDRRYGDGHRSSSHEARTEELPFGSGPAMLRARTPPIRAFSPEPRRSVGTASRALVAMVLLASACETPAILNAPDNAWHPSPHPCIIDVSGETTDASGREAMCCPEGFAAGGSPMAASCPPGSCCPFVEEMGKAPPMPASPSGGTLPSALAPP